MSNEFTITPRDATEERARRRTLASRAAFGMDMRSFYTAEMIDRVGARAADAVEQVPGVVSTTYDPASQTVTALVVEQRGGSEFIQLAGVVTPRKVPVHYPAERCATSGCGDKIKDHEMWLVEDGDTKRYYHLDCCDEDGTPVPWEP